ncbi:Acyl transferase/acyl hydrolase/lysophospholipase [Phytophthora cactorum]|nr:Acyl transferase/acyl hydrolase/lysophospholipase [Phytophthora cactorum]
MAAPQVSEIMNELWNSSQRVDASDDSIREVPVASAVPRTLGAPAKTKRRLTELHDVAQLGFGGCGGMYNYFLGVASVLQEEYDLRNVIFSGVSAGCFPALILALGMDVKEFFFKENVPLIEEAADCSYAGLGKWIPMVKHNMLKVLPSDAYQHADKKLYFSVTEVPALRNHLLTTWTSNEDMIDCMLCSAHVPLYTTSLAASYRGKRFVDGFSDMEVALVCTHLDFVTTNSDWAVELFRMGREDAAKNLHEAASVVKAEEDVDASDARKKRAKSKARAKKRDAEGAGRRPSSEKPRRSTLKSPQQKREDSSAHLVGSSSSSGDSDDRDSSSSSSDKSHKSSEGGGVTRRRTKRNPKSNPSDTKSERRYDSASSAAPEPGKFRYLKPDEIQSGQLPDYDFAVIVNRKSTAPRTPMDSIAEVSHERSGFRRLCMASPPVLNESEDEHRRIVSKLCNQGLLVDIIDGGDSKGEMHSGYLILLIRAPDPWSSVVDMEQDVAQRRDDPTTPAERIEIVDFIIEQRARLSKSDIWIHDLFPMHNQSVTNTLIHRWVTSWRLHELDDKKVLRSLRYNFGEKVAYYFAFLKYYNTWLIPLAAIGILLELLRGVISMTTYMRLLPFWGLGVSVVWGFGFLKSWERENACMQYDWTGKLHVKQIEYRNKQFYGESRVNALTGETELVYPAWRRLPKYFCVFLFMLWQMLIMLILVASWVTIYEILKATYKESYIFSTQWLLILLEGIIFGFFVDVVQWNMVVTKMGALFTHWENYRTEEQYEKALIRKLFLLDFLNYYTWFFSLAFVFVIPGLGNYLTNTFNHMFFGDEMNCCFGPYVDQDGSCTVCPVGDKDATCIECVGFFTFDRRHVDLSAMFVTPIVITQSLNILLRLVAPILVRKRREKAQARADAQAQRRVREAGSMKILGSLDYENQKESQFGNKSSSRYLEYTPSEIEVLNKKAREILFDSEQDTYDPYDDFHVLTVQFGFTVMFSIVKGRTDGYRLCKTLKRPIPRRANGIGAWKGILTTYAYIAVIVNVLLICISTGVLEFFDETCVKDIEHQLEKQGKTLDDFVFGPNFGCLHIAWRLLFILLLEHLFVAFAWIKNVMSSRENKFKALLREHELELFPPNSGSEGNSGGAEIDKKLRHPRRSHALFLRSAIGSIINDGGATSVNIDRSNDATITSTKRFGIPNQHWSSHQGSRKTGSAVVGWLGPLITVLGAL